jgi:hypothetical protein
LSKESLHRYKKHIVDESSQWKSQTPESSNGPTEQADADGNVAAVHGDNNTTSSQSGFLTMSQGLQRLVDDENEQDLEDLGTQSTDAFQLRIKLEDLFNFEDTWWIRTQEQIGMRGLDEELEVYELLDMDAIGEDDIDVDVDDMTRELMQN